MLTPLFNIRLADVVDILFVAMMFYTASVWVKRTRAAFVVRGLFILVVIYIIARQVGLELTAWIFQGFFAIFLIMVVVIFQEELRQVFERIAVWSFATQRPSPLRSETADILTRSLADLARDRVGALVVIQGKDPLGRHITGGIESDAKLSEPILKSIFDPHSPGHDGAVIIERDRISRFAAHLPLSKDLRQLSDVGTRHSAALGLAELTDALCLVVSEERGRISVARNSRLTAINNPQELGLALQQFLHEKYPPAAEQKWMSMQLVRENWLAKVVTLGLAIGLWYVLVPGSEKIEATYYVPVAVDNLPHDLAIESVKPERVQATFVGPKRAFYLFDPTKLRVSVDASLVESGRRTFKITEQNLRYPKDLNLQDLNPTTLQISVSRLSAKNDQKNRLNAP
jgi:diadenylate cyclase